MSGDASDSSEDSDTQTNEKACTVKHQITNGKSVILQWTRTYIDVRYHITKDDTELQKPDSTECQKLTFPF